MIADEDWTNIMIVWFKGYDNTLRWLHDEGWAPYIHDLKGDIPGLRGWVAPNDRVIQLLN